MVDRHWPVDLARAILLALPLAFLARPAAATINSIGSHSGMHAAAAHVPAGRISVLG